MGEISIKTFLPRILESVSVVDWNGVDVSVSFHLLDSILINHYVPCAERFRGAYQQWWLDHLRMRAEGSEGEQRDSNIGSRQACTHERCASNPARLRQKLPGLVNMHSVSVAFR